MIVWLASYPRSGNHLLRTILKRCFGLESYEIYQPLARPIDEAISTLIGARRFEEDDVDAFLSRARASSELFLVKTHDPVPDEDRCIYIVRDGRAALASYQRYISEIERRSVSLPKLIAGRQWPGKWQVHVGRFLARDPENTLILRYEELASRSPPLDRIGSFLNTDPIRRFDVTFADLHELSPVLFPIGSNDVGIELIERGHPWLFWRDCGAMMCTLGYAPDAGNGSGHAALFLSHPARYTGAILWPAIRSRLPRQRISS